jgi:hypothetical protein
MRSALVGGLSAQALQTALRKTTERLAAELADPAAATPDWSAAEWRVACAAATIHGAAPLLASRLRWQGPAHWRQFLHEQAVRAGARHRHMLELTSLIDATLHAAGIPAVALKGAALYAGALYQPGMRPMAGVDLLVRGADFEGATQALLGLGCHESQRLWKNRAFVLRAGAAAAGAPPGEHPLKIELHERICEMLPVRLVDISARVFPQTARPGLNPYPARAALMTHLLLHAAGSIVDRALRLIQLHDIALLGAALSPEEWAAAVGAEAWWAFPPLVLTARYYPGRLPQPVLAAARRHCPPLLRASVRRQRLSDVSLSFPWIEAFPALAWTRSPGEALGYVARRVVRDREATAMRELASGTEPGLSAGERRWLGVSQAERIVRWALSHPPRPLTMRAVRSSFGEGA